jgi:hypothetical protein
MGSNTDTVDDASDLSAQVSRKTTLLPALISTSVTAPATNVITSDSAPTAFTTLSITRASLVSEADGAFSTFTFIAPSVVTDPSQYSLLSAAAASQSLTRTHTATSHASSTGSSASTSTKSLSNLSTIVPAVVVPVAVILIATFVAFWLLMRRRHRRDLRNQPAFIMAAKTEKLTSTTNSVASDHRDHESPTGTQSAALGFSRRDKKPLPSTQSQDISPRPPVSSSGSVSNYSRGNFGGARTSNVREEQRPSPPLPPIRTDSSSPNTRHIANFATNTSPTSNYSPQTSRSANPHLGPQTPHNSIVSGTKYKPGRGPPPGVGTQNVVSARNRSQSLTNSGGIAGNRSSPYLNGENWGGQSPSQRPPTAPTSGFRGPQPRSFSPIGNRAPPPAPIKAPSPSTPSAFNQPQYSPIIRDAHKAKRPNVTVPPNQSPRGMSYGSHHSPLLPSPQSDIRRDHNLTGENLRIARLANSSRLGFGSPAPDNDDDGNVSEISAPDEEEDDAKSDVSSLNELEKFDFERDTRGGGSRSGSALGSLSGGVGGGRGGSAMNNYSNNSPVYANTHDSPWR